MFLCILLFEVTVTSFFKDKKSQNGRNLGFSYYFCLEGSGSRAGSGSIPLTNGSGSGSRRPKNMWIRIQIRFRNTAFGSHEYRIRPVLLLKSVEEVSRLSWGGFVSHYFYTTVCTKNYKTHTKNLNFRCNKLWQSVRLFLLGK